MAVDIFLKLEGIKGESRDDKYKDEIDVLAWSWGAAQSGTTHVGSGSGAGKVSVQDLSITKYIDKSSPTLFQHCCAGKHIKKGKLIVRKAGDKPLEYLTVELEDIIVSHLSMGGSGGEDRLTENVTLNFGTFHVKYAVQNADGSKGAETEHKWHIAKNVAG
ncbi:type VI secretion system secreted protein Hcp [Methylobacterium brachiatum]|jgi:type VI secretion system secreted protein Hcp|uniref:Type VI secretion system secreted protein Hcp n=1 Tax=Methylobacterium brachiatum TaxID=269660 RepID=A0AAJ1TTB2_9HYPH|nr:type VI secretion system tube protein Hcp [Methylobacterium brachiatum]MCB4805500.1 type VI secretion system tube protein Hcp [Methylobacterium brachiatum]MDQ0546551.1 type VI secretion system secreted protein Hcp [Methylobacterium brachiatum]